MIRTLLAIAALSAVPAAAVAQAAPDSNPAGVVVQAQTQEAYIIRLNVTGKEESEIRRMIWDASGTACRYAPRTNNALELNPTYMRACVKQAAYGGFEQLAALLERRQLGTPLQLAIVVGGPVNRY